ncbi:hypothetical protein [Streptomonospora sp. PA3]|uniref:hypothetical protein n=1 Tax=Streptomonospora sp. PA3 TaxID=2607326 RepID=UPI002105596D|nr:hypothetical protein [Streptomonospora sp. PA3]
MEQRAGQLPLQAWHAREHVVDGKMRNVFVREDAVTAHLGTFLVRFLARPGVPFEEVDVPHESAALVSACRDRGLTFTYEPMERALSTPDGAEEIVIRL